MNDILRVVIDERVAVATIDAPPINLMTLELLDALATFADDVEHDDRVTVVVLRSANPEFFIAHFDVEALLADPLDEQVPRAERLGRFHRMCERFHTMSKATICEIAGRVGGGGAELAASCDMRFGAGETFMLNQMEVPLGILPGGSGTQRIPRLVGRGRAMEIVLGGDDIDAATAERWGWLNRAVPADELPGVVADLAQRIASSPAGAVAAAKQSVLNSATMEPTGGLLEEQFLFRQLLRTPDAQRRMRAFLANGGQTVAGERRVAEVSRSLRDR